MSSELRLGKQLYEPRLVSLPGRGSFRCSVADVVDDVFERLTGEVAADLVDAEAEGAVDELGCGAGDVGGDEELGADQSGCPAGRGSGSVTSTAARMWCALRASTRASVSTTGPRAALMRSAPVFMRAISRAPMRPRVSG